MNPQPINQKIVQTLQAKVPKLLAIYAFGSRIQGAAQADSDLDLAVLVAGYAEPLALWALAGDLADLAGCPVDLLDLRAASTVMQYQIITTGQRWWAADATTFWAWAVHSPASAGTLNRMVAQWLRPLR